jgi:uncharacterized protein YjbJ (UPF0337 family)
MEVEGEVQKKLGKAQAGFGKLKGDLENTTRRVLNCSRHLLSAMQYSS